VPEVLARGDHERGLVVVVEGTEAEEVGPVLLESYAASLGQALDRDLVLEAFEEVIGDPGHRHLRFPGRLSRGGIDITASCYV
jgi:hypothetical protein